MKEPEHHRTRVAADRGSETQEQLFSGLILASERQTKVISIEEIYTHAETS